MQDMGMPIDRALNVRDINLTPAELLAILEHKRQMTSAGNRPVTLEEAMTHFILHFRVNWLKDKHRRDNRDQLQEIERHKYFRSQNEGRDIGKALAAEEWCANYASIWRAERESLERNGFLKISVVVASEHGLHTRPDSMLAEMCRQFDSEVYLHRQDMTYYNFLLQGRPYLNVSSIIGLLTVDAVQGELLEFIATGPDAKPALETIAHYIRIGSPLEHTMPG